MRSARIPRRIDDTSAHPSGAKAGTLKHQYAARESGGPEEVMTDAQKVKNLFETFCRTDTQLDENILSRDEYQKALKGKRHWKDGG
jgi:hypothetical protein